MRSPNLSAAVILSFSLAAFGALRLAAQTGSSGCPQPVRACRQLRPPKSQASHLIDCGTVSCPPNFQGKFSRDWTKIQDLLASVSSTGAGYQPRAEAFDLARKSGLIARWGQGNQKTAESYGSTGGAVTFFDPVTNREVAALYGMIIDHFPPPPHRAKR